MTNTKTIFIWACILLATTSAHKVVESTEDIDPVTAASNTTTLYPVKPINRTESSSKQKTATSWKIETTFGESKLDSNSTGSSEQLVLERPSNGSEEFKPSQPLGNFIEHGSFETGPTKSTPDSFARIKKPPAGFISSSKTVKFPKEVFKNFQQFPYKLEPPIFTKAKDGWQPSVSSLESRPTDEAPVSVPAGGLYKLPLDPFRIKPGTTEEDFGLEFSGDHKERPIKKRVNPMSNLLHLLTALIPVGIIFSALTPSLITIEPEQTIPPNIFRRADGTYASLPQISERCRRRLLCELHSETNYPQSGPSKRANKCHRIHCEDPESLSQTLQWLLSHHSPTSGLSLRPNEGLNNKRPTGVKPNYGHNKPNDGQLTGLRPNSVVDVGLKTNNGYGQRPNGHIGHVKHRPNEGYGSYRPIEGDTGDHFNADFT